jgi:Tol biopolymer transport system component
MPTCGRVGATVLALVVVSSFGPSRASVIASVPGANGWIAFTMLAEPGNDEIFVTDADGAGPIRLTNHPEPIDQRPAVAPSGKEIAFDSQRDDVTTLPDGTVMHSNLGRDTELYVMDIADDDGDGNGDNLRRLTDNTAADNQVAWSPDGRKVAFHSTRDGNSELYVMDADGDEVQRLTTHSAIDQLPVFSPDGSRIAFTSNRDGNFEIYIINADASGSPTRLTNNAAQDAWPEFSPDGAMLAFGSNRDGDFDIWVMSLSDTSISANLTDGLLSDNGLSRTNERWPAWAPDGGSVAVWSGLGTGFAADARIKLVAANGSGLIRVLSPDGAGAAFPDWGPARQTREH